VFENRVLRRIFGLKRDEVTGEWRKLYNEKLRDLYSSPSIIRIIKSRMRWTGHVARIERRGTRIDYWWESQTESDHCEYQDLGEWITLGWILGRWDGVMWAGLVWLRIETGGELL
jgi:hypothetical protein